MERQESTLAIAARTRPKRRAFGGLAWSAVLALAIAVGVLVWIEAIAPTLLALVIAVGLAVGWCIWLDGHPEVPTGAHREE